MGENTLLTLHVFRLGACMCMIYSSFGKDTSETLAKVMVVVVVVE